MSWRNGRIVEAVDCAGCNSVLEWEGDLPDDVADVLCHNCVAEERDKFRAENERLRRPGVAKLRLSSNPRHGPRSAARACRSGVS